MCDDAWLAHPGWMAALWVFAQLVFALLGYYQGRKDEELRWRRIVGPVEKRLPWDEEQ